MRRVKGVAGERGCVCPAYHHDVTEMADPAYHCDMAKVVEEECHHLTIGDGGAVSMAVRKQGEMWTR